ncbi:inner membrane peptidase [Marinobacterium mangrovicola]|uniref:Inner membrane peptidase n=1 Tax=Marinobacterium mangrovicola TaxID=1476959 RepID=A0A4R1GRN3_9GAMM|nr:protease SohB [Marinobacterium mangrovicola]TCK08869.1 inner membrane peptidase [Marinobacterium mangrovicola]
MTEFLAEYGLFLAKTLTLIIGILLVVAGVGAAVSKRREAREGHVEVKHINRHFEEMQQEIEDEILDESRLKQMHKEQKKRDKQEAKERKKAAKKGTEPEPERKRIYVLDFDGDLHASQVDWLREEISAVLMMARKEDEVVVRLESGGGLVHGYGLAASQLERIRRREIPLTICVDKVAASGGYMMACIANKLLTAPFALVGSIGVVAQLPNFHRLLKKHDVDYEVFTAGEYKRTVTLFGENTEHGRKKFVEELEDTHGLFKEFVAEYRPELDLEKIATGEVWFGKRALGLGLIDGISTSDDYLFDACENADVYRVSYELKKGLQERLSNFSVQTADRLADRLVQKLQESRFWSR